MEEIERQTRDYYASGLENGNHAAWLAFDGPRLVATGGVSFYRVMPTCCNPSGEKAYLMNIYTDPAYRRRGVATRMVDRLVSECVDRGVDFVTLEATQMGRPLYLKYGFVSMEDEMILSADRLPLKR